MTARLEIDDRVARLRLDRPESRNAFDFAMVTAVDGHLEKLADSSADVLVIEGAGRHLCAGGDVREMVALSSAGRDACRAFFADLFGLLDTLVALPQIVVARVHGVAAGFGLALVLNADVAVAGSEARLGAPELRLGLQPTGIAAEAVRWLPPAIARDWLLQPRLRTAGEALAAGAVARVVDDADLDAAVNAVVDDLLAAPADVLRRTKTLVREFERDPLDGRRERSVEAAADALSSPGAGQRLEAFMDRR